MSRKKKKDLPKIYERKWLNENEGSAYSILEAKVQEGWNFKDRVTVDASLQLKDCNRQIELEFQYWSEEDYQQRLRKVNDLLATVQKLKDFMVANPFKAGTKLTKEEIKERNKKQKEEDEDY